MLFPVTVFTTPDSLNKLPNISIPTNGAVVGKIITTTIVTMIGNKIFQAVKQV